METVIQFKQVFESHRVWALSFHESMALTMKAVLDDPAVAEPHKLTAARSISAHLQTERRLPEIERAFTRIFGALQ